MSMMWRTEAACRPGSGVDPEVFFPVAEPGTLAHDLQVDESRAICARCPVRSECLAFALETGQEFGTFAGTTPDQRRRLRQRRPATTAA